jgi:uncharacterized protein YkwD
MDTTRSRAGLAAAVSAACLLATVVHDPKSADAKILGGSCAGADMRGGPGAGRLEAMTCLLDAARQADGLRRLRVDPRLRHSAVAKANDIARCKRFAHDPCNAGWAGALRRSGYAAGRVRIAENLAWAINRSPREVLSMWLASPEHRANLLDPQFRATGLARRTARLPDVGKVEVWVQQFGAR